MTERFTVDDGLEDVLCWEINDKENENMTCGECVKLLNELYEENEQLKNALRHNYVEHKRCVNNYVDKIKEVEKENEQLRKDATILIYSNQDYRRENEQLKHRIAELQNELNNCEEDYIFEEYL